MSLASLRAAVALERFVDKSLVELEKSPVLTVTDASCWLSVSTIPAMDFIEFCAAVDILLSILEAFCPNSSNVAKAAEDSSCSEIERA